MTSVDPLPPNSVEAEEALIGSVLLDPQVLSNVEHIISPDSFYITRNRWAWEAMQRIQARHEQIDYLTLTEELRTQGRLDEIGGPAYITKLTLNTPSSIYAETYAQIVERASLRRRLLAAASRIAKLAHDEEADLNEVLGESERAVFEVAQRRDTGEIEGSAAIMGRVLDDVQRAMETGISGIKSGLADLDKLTGGWQDTDLIVIGGRPGMGKTSALLTFVKTACEDGHVPGIISKEMTNEQLGKRLISMECGVTSDQMRTGKLTADEFLELTKAVSKISQWKFKAEDGAKKHIRDVAAIARRMKRDGITMLAIDYLTLLDGDGENQVNKVTDIIQGCKSIARELQIPVLVAAQLNRNVDSRRDKRPMLSDLRDSGGIEQAADLILFIYRDEEYNKNTEYPNQAEFNLAKHRNGPTGTVRAYFRKERTQFTNLSKTPIDLGDYSDHSDNAPSVTRRAKPVHDFKRAAGADSDPIPLADRSAAGETQEAAR